MTVSQNKVLEGHHQASIISEEPPRKRARLLSDEDSDHSSSSDTSGGIPVKQSSGINGSLGFKINEEYARRFEHNQRRTELHRRMLQALR